MGLGRAWRKSLVNIKLYVEGGGDRKALRRQCRKAFKRFLEDAELGGGMPRIVACGGREKAFKGFLADLRNKQHSDSVILLVDSEDPVTGNSWAHLKNRDNWDRPEGAEDWSAQLMVQCMEAWFLADKECLAKYFGAGFNRRALPANSRIERIPRKDLIRGLENASRHCTGKGMYSKGKHSFEILARLRSARVIEASPHAKRLVNTLRDIAEAQ